MLSLGWAENGKKQLLKQLQKHPEQCASSASPSDDGLAGGRGGGSILPGEGTKPKPQVPSIEVEKLAPQLCFIHKNVLKARKCDSHQVRH